MTTLSNPQKLAAARLAAAKVAPYFTTALLSLVPREAHGLNTFAVTEKMVLLWDPAALERWSVQQTAAVLVHEISHVLRDHFARAKALGADPKLFNIAEDMEINDDIKAMGLELPDGCMLPSTFEMADGLTAEEYYHNLPRDQEQQANQPCAGNGWCGSAAGRAVPGEPDPSDATSGRSASEVANVRAQTAEAIRAQAAKTAGSVPAGWERWADVALQPPKIRWQDKLARHARNAVAFRPGAVDYRFSRPSRRQAALGYGAGRPVLPALVAPVPQVAIAIDTSGSMGPEELSAAVAECQGIFGAVGASVDFVACDAEVHVSKRVSSPSEIIANLKGGGGTDFRPVFDNLVQKRPRPEVVVFVTDGYGPAPEAPPYGMRVIWLLVGAMRRTPAPYGDVIEVDDGARDDD